MWIKVWHRVLDDHAILGLTAISSLQTAHDILHELCEMLGLQSEEDIEEFGLYADPGKRTCVNTAQYTVHYLYHLPCM